MKLNADGRRRLELMKKALAAGMPLAGLLAVSAGCGKGADEKPVQWQGKIVIVEDEGPLGLLDGEECEADEGRETTGEQEELPSLIELKLAEEVSTIGILLPEDLPLQKLLPSPEDNGNRSPGDDVVVRVEDAEGREEGAAP
jgi:hypothetical protein